MEFQLTTPFSWEPELPEGSWIVQLKTEIIRYPANYGVSSEGYHYRPVILIWIEDRARVPGRNYLNYFYQQVSPPQSIRPTGIEVGWPSDVTLKGWATLGTAQSSDGELEILRRIESKIDALP